MDKNGELKKGPWKIDEDEVLIEHCSCSVVYSSSYHLCILIGVKFSAEEEKTVIDLQAKFGNKWAKISTYLQGRTDNDVKNFWSSRKKRLQRIQQTIAPKSNSQKRNKQITSLHDVSPLEAPKLSSSTKEEPLSKSLLRSSSYNHKAAIVNPDAALNFERKMFPHDLCPMSTSIKSEPSFISHQIPQFEPDFGMLLEGQEFIPRLGDSSFLDIFQQTTSELTDLQRSNASLIFPPERSSRVAGYEEIDDPLTPDSFIDDLPLDIFDQIESLPSPSQW
ncbi:hypothetical protein Leryth_017473 [Lithospermum erythrorhizon]|nr:hypothetical protein Leryth_017473 [Lithospermum erythrorhizon]